jgi:hypothetical protein
VCRADEPREHPLHERASAPPRGASTASPCTRARRDHDQHLPRRAFSSALFGLDTIETDVAPARRHIRVLPVVRALLLPREIRVFKPRTGRADATTTVEVEERDLRLATDLFIDADLSCVCRAAYLTPNAQVSTPSLRAQDKDGRLAVLFWVLC